MSREIKYRAWDKEEEVMIDWFWLNSEGEAYETPVTLYDTPHLEIERNDDLIVMQYTNLKDKNGVEIYEGDVVKRTYLFNGGYGETHTGEVVYDKEYARYVISGPNKHIEPRTEDLGNILSDISTYEVIGNIYKNPTLLEALP